MKFDLNGFKTEGKHSSLCTDLQIGLCTDLQIGLCSEDLLYLEFSSSLGHRVWLADIDCVRVCSVSLVLQGAKEQRLAALGSLF